MMLAARAYLMAGLSLGAFGHDAAGQRLIVTQPTVFYVRSDGNNANPGLGDSKDAAWADPQYALLYVENKLDFGEFDVTIHIDASTTPNRVWAPSAAGYSCTRLHLGSGLLIVEGDRDGSTVIDGPTAGAIVARYGCEIFIQDLTIQSATGDGLVSIAQSRVFFSRIRWGRAGVAQAFVSRGALIEQIGDDTISGSALYHIVASHEGHFRVADVTTRFTDDATFQYFAYASSLGDITYTGNAKFDLGGKVVTGIRCFADNLGIVQASLFGPNFFPGNQACSSAAGGEVFD